MHLDWKEIGLGFLILALVALAGFLPRRVSPPTNPGPANSEYVPLPLGSGQAFYEQTKSAWDTVDSLSLFSPQPSSPAPPVSGEPVSDPRSVSPRSEATSPAVAQPVPPTSTSPVLELPPVLDSELSVSQDGIRSFAEYTEYLGSNGQKVAFPANEYKALLAEYPNGLPLPEELVAQALGAGGMSKIHAALVLYQEFLRNKIDFFKTIRVSGDMVELNRKMIAIDRLTLELLDKALQGETGKVSLADVKDFNIRYNNTIAAERQTIKSKFGDLLADASRGMVSKLFQTFGFVSVAKALGLGFGGHILYVERIACSCTGMLVTVGPPVPGAYMLYWAVYASPAIFLYKNISETAYILGNYLPGVGYCAPPPFCIGAPGLNSITIAGTS